MDADLDDAVTAGPGACGPAAEPSLRAMQGQSHAHEPAQPERSAAPGLSHSSASTGGARGGADNPWLSSDAPLRRQGKPRRVQLIEDLPRVQRVLRDLIEEPGVYEICSVADTETAALADFDAHRPDVVIIDLNLRQGSGLGFLQHVRRRDLDRRPLLVVVTNHTLPVLEAACMRAGADHFLDKSRDLGRLREVMDRGLAGPDAGTAPGEP